MKSSLHLYPDPLEDSNGPNGRYIVAEHVGHFLFFRTRLLAPNPHPGKPRPRAPAALGSCRQESGGPKIGPVGRRQDV